MNWRHLVDEALDEAFKQRVIQLFGALVNDQSAAAYDKFKQGLENAKKAYDELVTILEM